ncbi:MAG: GntR family transcriptional regulator [Alphaproteobacteria bacterium]|nr:GntR family transcriptional regulator [Alphaproteobacteria bacterium]
MLTLDTAADDQPKTLGQIAYEALKAMILSGEIRPGERLAERELARRIRVSRTPLREALGWLTRDGLAVSRPGQGYYALEFDPRIIAEMYEFREMLEVHAARHAAERISDAGLAEIKDVMERLADYEKQENLSLEQLRDEVHLGLKIHEIIARQCGNDFVCEALLQVYDRLRLLTWIDVLWFDKWNLTREEHRALVEAVTAHDPEKAAQAARHHVQRCSVDALWVIKAQHREGNNGTSSTEARKPR